MKKAYILITSLCLLAGHAIAGDFSASNLYGRIDSGYSWSSNSDSSAIIGAGIGYKFTDYLRADVTLGYRGWYNTGASTTISGSTISGNADTSTFDGLANVYYDVGHYGRFTPYIGGGVGFASNTLDSAGVAINGVNVGSINSNTQTNFAWQLGAGTAYQITDNIALDIGYRYLDMGKVSTGDNLTLNNGTVLSGATVQRNLNASEVQAGLRYSF